MSAAIFFHDQKEWRAWLEKNHATASEQWVGFYKAGTDKKGIAYKEAVDEALCFGWIDAVRRGGHATWSIRFTPRKKGSIWSAVNIRRIEELKALGRVAPAGLAAYEGRDPEKQKKYSFENRDVVLAPEYEKRFRADKAAWAWFEAMPRSYRHPAVWWVMSAKQEATRERRLATLIADSAAGRKVKHADGGRANERPRPPLRLRPRLQRRRLRPGRWRRRSRWVGGTVRSADRAAGQGIAHDSLGRHGAGRRCGRGARRRHAPPRLDPARRRRSGARPFQRGHPRRAASRMDRLSLHRRRLWRLRRRLGERGDDAASAIGPRAPAPRRRDGVGRRSPPSAACRWRSSALPASTGPAAMRWSISPRAGRTASSSRARSSTASMSTTSSQVLTAALAHERRRHLQCRRRRAGPAAGCGRLCRGPDGRRAAAGGALRQGRALAHGALLLWRQQARRQRAHQAGTRHVRCAFRPIAKGLARCGATGRGGLREFRAACCRAL